MECQGHDKHLREKKVWVNDENIIYIYELFSNKFK